MHKLGMDNLTHIAFLAPLIIETKTSVNLLNTKKIVSSSALPKDQNTLIEQSALNLGRIGIFLYDLVGYKM